MADARTLGATYTSPQEMECRSINGRWTTEKTCNFRSIHLYLGLVHNEIKELTVDTKKTVKTQTSGGTSWRTISFLKAYVG